MSSNDDDCPIGICRALLQTLQSVHTHSHNKQTKLQHTHTTTLAHGSIQSREYTFQSFLSVSSYYYYYHFDH